MNLFTNYRTANRTLYRQDVSFQGNMPHHLRISLMESCNLRCYMCHLSALPEPLKSTLYKEPMSLDWFYRLAEDAFPYADKVTFGFAGEPTLHPKFPEILRKTDEFGIEIEIWTNGTTLHQESITQAILEHADWVVVSMDGANEEAFARARGGADLPAIEISIRSLRETAQKIRINRPLHIGAHSTLMHSTIAQLPAVVEKAHGLGMDRVSASHIGIFDGNLMEESLFLYKEETDHYLERAKAKAAVLGIVVDFPPQFRASSNAQAVSHFRCNSINDSVIVLCNGDVLPCCHASARFRMVMGNLQTNRFPDVWYGRKYGLLRSSFSVEDYTPACRDCVANNPFMDVTRVWDLDTYSERARNYPEHNEFIPAFMSCAKEFLRRQNQWYGTAVEAERKFSVQLERLSALETQVRKRFQLASWFEQHRGSSIEHFSLFGKRISELPLDRTLNRWLYEQGMEFYGNYPLHLEVSIMAGCNIDCIMCNIVRFSKDERKELLRQFMRFDTYLRLVDQVFPWAESIFFGIGGEPTLHPQFSEMVRLAANSGLKVQVTTHGLTLHSDKIARTCVHHLQKLIISMDGACPETYERIRRGASWEKLLLGIQKVVALRQKVPDSRLQLAVNFTLMKNTIDEFPDMVTLAHELGIEKVMAEHLIVTAPDLESQSLFSTPEHADQSVLEALERAQNLGIQMEVPDLFCPGAAPKNLPSGAIRNIRPQDIPRDMPFCRILDYSLVIMPDGRVQPCSHPDAQFPMGNLMDQSFSDIWFGRRYQMLREGTQGVIPHLCQNCSMSGRSDGMIPVQNHLSPNFNHEDHSSESQPVPKTFLARRIRFLGKLIDQEQEIQTHLKSLHELEKEMERHERNIRDIIERKSHRFSLFRKRLQKAYLSELRWLRFPPRSVAVESHFSFSVKVRNIGAEPWPDGTREDQGAVMIGGAFYNGGQQMAYMQGWSALPNPLPPDQETEITIRTNVVGLHPGAYTLRLDAVKLGVGFFEEFGSKPLEFPIEVSAPDECETLWNHALTCCTNLWTPSQGVRRGRTLSYPLFLTRADKARVTDLSGREYLDYIMGWGTATLGYNRPEIQEAVAAYLSVGPTLPLPHPLQVDVADRLCSFLPCAERILFGKNGSDVLEAAVRIARAYTQRDHVLCCGYHGFHDWYVASIDGVAGVPQALRALVHPFPYGKLEALRSLLNALPNQIAAVVMEPASLAYPPDGYLETIRTWTQNEGIVLIFDEIISAFRLANGGAQEKYGIKPDLVAVGKGIANGLPLAALGGHRLIMDQAVKIGYGPTFQGEVYALAAARAALDIYAREPICTHLNALGKTLRDGILDSAAQHGIEMDLPGILPRQVLQFKSQSNYSPAMIRTYVLQELLEMGILCGGTFLPSYAHTQEDIACTVDILESIFVRLNDLLKNQSLAEEIRIPLNVLYLGEDTNEK